MNGNAGAGKTASVVGLTCVAAVADLAAVVGLLKSTVIQGWVSANPPAVIFAFAGAVLLIVILIGSLINSRLTLKNVNYQLNLLTSRPFEQDVVRYKDFLKAAGPDTDFYRWFINSYSATSIRADWLDRLEDVSSAWKTSPTSYRDKELQQSFVELSESLCNLLDLMMENFYRDDRDLRENPAYKVPSEVKNSAEYPNVVQRINAAYRKFMDHYRGFVSLAQAKGVSPQ